MATSKTGGVTPPSGTITVPLTLTLAEANTLLVALVNAINNASSKGKGGDKGGGAKGGGKAKGKVVKGGTPKTKAAG